MFSRFILDSPPEPSSVLARSATAWAEREARDHRLSPVCTGNPDMGSTSARSPRKSRSPIRPTKAGKISYRVMNRSRRGRRIHDHSPQGEGMDRRVKAAMGCLKNFFDD
jgi:hypothetical protein